MARCFACICYFLSFLRSAVRVPCFLQESSCSGAGALVVTCTRCCEQTANLAFFWDEEGDGMCKRLACYPRRPCLRGGGGHVGRTFGLGPGSDMYTASRITTGLAFVAANPPRPRLCRSASPQLSNLLKNRAPKHRNECRFAI